MVVLLTPIVLMVVGIPGFPLTVPNKKVSPNRPGHIHKDHSITHHACGLIDREE